MLGVEKACISLYRSSGLQDIPLHKLQVLHWHYYSHSGVWGQRATDLLWEKAIREMMMIVASSHRNLRRDGTYYYNLTVRRRLLCCQFTTLRCGVPSAYSSRHVSPYMLYLQWYIVLTLVGEDAGTQYYRYAQHTVQHKNPRKNTRSMTCRYFSRFHHGINCNTCASYGPIQFQ